MALHRLVRLTATAALAAGLAAGPALAQQQTGSFSEEQLRSFANAASEVERINMEYIQRMQTAESSPERQDILEQANGRAVDAVRNTDGISLGEYSEIAEAAKADPALAAQIDGYMSEAAN